MIDDNQKRFVPHLAIETELFHSAFVNPCMMKNQRRSQSGVHPITHLAIECIMGNYCTRWRPLALKGSHEMGDGWNFLKSRRASLFNDDLSNEPNLGRIHLAGQYL